MSQEIKLGQHWQEFDPRYPNLPHKEVVGFEPDGRVVLQAVGSTGPTGRRTKAKPDRFNGKRSGYRLVRDAP